MVTKMPQTALSTNSALELVAGLRPSQCTDEPRMHLLSKHLNARFDRWPGRARNEGGIHDQAAEVSKR